MLNYNRQTIKNIYIIHTFNILLINILHHKNIYKTQKLIGFQSFYWRFTALGIGIFRKRHMRRWKVCWSLRITNGRKTYKKIFLSSTYMYLNVNLQVLESSARLKFELDESVTLRMMFSLLPSLCFVFFCSFETGTHLKIFMVVSPIVTHFFSLEERKGQHWCSCYRMKRTSVLRDLRLAWFF